MDTWSRDEQLARRCIQGDERAWGEFVDTYTPMVHSLCHQAGLGPADAEDVCQEVMLSALRTLRTYKGCRLSTWLYRVTRRRLADHFRSPQRRQVPAGLPEDPSLGPGSGGAPNPERQAIETSEAERARRALQDLGEPARSVMLAYYLAEIPVREIALELGMPENTVKSHLRRGRKAVHRLLEER